MLVTFSCDHHPNIVLFGSVAMTLLTMMGHSPTVPGAILAKDVPEALALLKQSIALLKPESHKLADDIEPDVSLVHRALPLIGLLEHAQNNSYFVMWE